MARSAAWTRQRRRATPWDPRFFERSPHFRPLLAAARRFESEPAFPSPEVVDRLLSPLAGVRFVAQAPRPSRGFRRPPPVESMYDAQILRGVVPTRAGSWHDLMNALVWATFPKSKRALHARQAALVVPGAPARARALDALALLDEGGVLVAVREAARGEPSPEVLDDSFDEEALRAAVEAGRAELFVFGHALLEAFVLGARPMVAAAVRLAAPAPGTAGAGGPREIDEALAAELADPSTFQDPRAQSRLTLVGEAVPH